MAQEALPGMQERKWGRIVAITSSGARQPIGFLAASSVARAGVSSFLKTLATEVAADGITVNAIAPGFIETRLTSAMPVAIREVARRMSAVGQGGKPEDVGQAITFLATPGAVGVTGATVRVCGGALIGA